MNSAIAAQLQSARLQSSLPSAMAGAGIAGGAAGRGEISPQIREAAEDFEAMFLSEMFKPMFENLKTDGMFGGGEAEKTYRGMLVQEYGKAMAQSGGIGLADQIAREMLKMQEVQG